MTPQQLLTTLQLNDSLFPTGGFAYSDGLETAVSNGLLTDTLSLERWLQFYISSVFEPCEGLAVQRTVTAHGREDWDALKMLDAELTAMKPAASMRASSASLGKRFLKSVTAFYSHPGMQRLGDIHNLPIVYGVVFSSMGVEIREVLLSFAYTRLAGTISAALRLMPIGQEQAQSALKHALEWIPAAVDRIVENGDAELTSFAPFLDIQQMNHRYVYSRLFRT